MSANLIEMLQSVPMDHLIAELERRRQQIDHALEARLAWQTRDQPLLAIVARHWGISSGRMFQKTRERRITDARQACMVILRNQGRVFTEVAQMFSMDYTTVMHAVATHENRMTDPIFASRFHAACNEIQS